MDYTYKIECTILATLLQGEQYFNETPFVIEDKYFTHFFNKIIAGKISTYIKEDKSLSLLEMKIDNWVKNDKPELQVYFLEILASNVIPISKAKEYYNELKLIEMKRSIYGR